MLYDVSGQHRNALYLDLEFTCWNTAPPPGMKQEIIEVGVVAMNLETLTITDEAAYFVRPDRWEISSKCAEITGITAKDIRTARPLSLVMEAVAARFSPSGLPCFAWGDDVPLLDKACHEKRFKCPFRRGPDLSAVFQGAFATKDRSSLQNAVSSLGLAFEGFAHGALHDARNTAHVHAAMLRSLRKSLRAQEESRPDVTAVEPATPFAQKLAACIASAITP
jgi:inhibitor of KinA sporulation pathway (predicted exonuclease)